MEALKKRFPSAVTAKIELRTTKIMNDGVTIKQNLHAVCVEAEKGYVFSSKK